MEKKGKNVPSAESSILLQPPNPMLSFNELSESPVLMPVAVTSNDDMQSYASNQNIGSNATDLSSNSSTGISTPLSQLEQPLIMRKSPSNPVTHVPPALSTSHSDSHRVGYPLDAIPPPLHNLPQKNIRFGRKRSEEIFPGAQDIANSDWHADHSIHPSGSSVEMSGSTFCDVTRSHTEPLFMETTSNVLSHQDLINSSHSDVYYKSDFTSVPVKQHWLFKDTVENKEIWYGFSEFDNERLEAAFQKDSQSIVPTDGGRYDVFIEDRLKKSVYFDTKDLDVNRGTWFYQISSSSRYKPYAEEVAKTLEKHYCHCANLKQWQRRFNVPGIGSFSFESAEVLLQYKDDLEVWPSSPNSKANPIVVKRGLPDGFEILPSEHTNIDHLVFIVQGIGSFCDLRFRTVSQCVDGFRDIANKLIGSHFKREVESGEVGRIEFLPVAWHSKLHTSDVGLDRRMKSITLPSIPKLRHFTNDTLLDILLYSTPTYCQSIIDTVACELNEMYELFLNRNPGFIGKIFVAGHSLGSLILFDILANQINAEPKPTSSDTLFTFTDVQSLLKYLNLEDYFGTFNEQGISIETLSRMRDEDLNNLGIPTDICTKLLNYLHPKEDKTEITDEPLNLLTSSDQIDEIDDEMTNTNNFIFPTGKPKNGMSLIDYPRLKFLPAGFFALGSPISMFLAVRGYNAISEDFAFPTCPAFFHIFHPYDPVAFRIEPLIDPKFSENPVLIPHHKGRKRMHLEIRENVTKFASEIKQKVTETMRFTWNSLNEFAKNYSFPSAMVTAEVDKLVELKMSEAVETEIIESSKEDIKIGLLNGGRRIDYVLQEKPIEALNDYVFALTSHATYWNSEDTVLIILREIYAMEGIIISAQQTDPKVPPENISSLFQGSADTPILESISSLSLCNEAMNSQVLNTDPVISSPSEVTATTIAPSSNSVPPICDSAEPHTTSSIPGNIGPPPLSGFVKRSPFMR